MDEQGKLLITTAEPYQNERVAGLVAGRRLAQIKFFFEQQESVLNRIYIARVSKVLSNLCAAFVEIEKGVSCYLPLDHIEEAFFTKKLGSSKICQGDELVVQVAKEAVKSKTPTVSTRLTLISPLCILQPAYPGAFFSRRLSPEDCARLQEWYRSQSVVPQGCGVLFRTESKDASVSELNDELFRLANKWEKILAYSRMRTCYSCLYRPDESAASILNGFYTHEYSEIITDLPEIYEELKNSQTKIPVRFYDDRLLPLSKLYNVDQQLMDAICKKKIWLSSGASIVIEQTEALVSIDVNSGKNTAGKNKEDAICRINMEAAKEIAFQIRLRRLCGIIIIDFINMNRPENNDRVLEALRTAFLSDPQSPIVVDMTALGLVEVTRRKRERPLCELEHRQLARSSGT